MKKILMAIFMAVVLVASLAVFVACGNNGELVNTEGTYKSATADEVKTLVSDVSFEDINGLELSVNVEGTVPSSDDSTKTQQVKGTITAVASYKDGKVTMSGSLSVTGLQEEAMTASFYMDTEYFYMAMNDQKLKVAVDTVVGGVGGVGSVGGSVEVPEIDLGAVIDMYSQYVKFEVAESGNTVKVKLDVEVQEQSIEAYVVLQNKKFQGLAVNTELDLYGAQLKVNAQLAVSSKAVTAPSDLDSYTEVDNIMPF